MLASAYMTQDSNEQSAFIENTDSAEENLNPEIVFCRTDGGSEFD